MTPWRACTGTGSWQDLWPCGKPVLEESVPEGLHPVEGTHAAAGAEGEESSP